MPIIEYKESAPIGTIMAFPIDKIPNGWLICNGAAISRTTYKALFNVIGTTYGAGDGSTTFNLPDFQGKFLRGYGSYDSNRRSGNIAQVQEDTIQNHRHRFAAYGVKDGGGPGRSGSGYNWDAWTSWLSEDGFRQSAETRPINMAVIYCIKY